MLLIKNQLWPVECMVKEFASKDMCSLDECIMMEFWSFELKHKHSLFYIIVTLFFVFVIVYRN